jgi:hypothetical protein
MKRLLELSRRAASLQWSNSRFAKLGENELDTCLHEGALDGLQSRLGAVYWPIELLIAANGRRGNVGLRGEIPDRQCEHPSRRPYLSAGELPRPSRGGKIPLLVVDVGG